MSRTTRSFEIAWAGIIHRIIYSTVLNFSTPLGISAVGGGKCDAWLGKVFG